MIVLGLPILLILMIIVYVKRLPYVLHCLCMVPSLLVLMHLFCVIVSFFLYHQFATLSLLLPVHRPSDCCTYRIHNVLLFIDTLYFWHLHLCILYVYINSTSNIFTSFSIIGTLPASSCTCMFT